MFKIICPFLVALATFQTYANASSDEGDYETVCEGIPREIGIVYDSSVSISQPDFSKGKVWLQKWVKSFNIGDGPENSRVSLITFGKGVYPENGFNLTSYHTYEEVSAAIGGIIHMNATYTGTGDGIHYMSQVQLSPDVARPGIDRIAIVMTDGDSQERSKTANEAKIARDAGIQVFAIGIGAVKQEELIRIAGDEDRVLKVDSYDDLHKIEHKLKMQTCRKILKPTTIPPPPPTTEPPQNDPPATGRVCEYVPREIGIVYDSSQSINEHDFEQGKKFLQSFLTQFNIGENPDSTRVAIITFGNGTYPEDAYYLTSHQSVKDVVAAVGRVKHQHATYTGTGDGINYMSQVQLSPAVSRPGVDRVAIIITDGDSQNWRRTEEQAKLARDEGIKMFAVGIGGGVNKQELLNIAGDAERVIKVETYDDLHEIEHNLAQDACHSKVVPLTTPLPQTTCGNESPADIYFAFSPAELCAEGTAWTTSFISSTVGSEEMQDGFRFGVVSADDGGFDLDDFSGAGAIQARVNQFRSGTWSKLVARLSGGGFSEASGGRPDARHIAVLVAGGGKRTKALRSEAATLIAMGVEVFIADPTNSGITVRGATTLTGSGPRGASIDFISYLCNKRDIPVCR